MVLWSGKCLLDESEIWVEKVSSMEEKRGPEGKKRLHFWEKVAFLRGEIVVLEKSGMVWEEKWSCLWEKSGVFERRDRSFGEEWYFLGENA